MNEHPESTQFFVRNEAGELVATVPEILNYLREKVERAREKFGATDLDLLWCLEQLSSDIVMKIWILNGWKDRA